MSLRIRFTHPADYEPGLARGQIALDDFTEDFESSLASWTVQQYEDQWRTGIDRLVQGAACSCLITSLWSMDPEYEAWGVWWALYRDGDRVVLQHHLMLSSVLGENFDPTQPYASVRERRYFTDDGVPVSEWSIKLDLVEVAGSAFQPPRTP